MSDELTELQRKAQRTVEYVRRTNPHLSEDDLIQRSVDLFKEVLEGNVDLDALDNQDSVISWLFWGTVLSVIVGWQVWRGRP